METLKYRAVIEAILKSDESIPQNKLPALKTDGTVLMARGDLWLKIASYLDGDLGDYNESKTNFEMIVDLHRLTKVNTSTLDRQIRKVRELARKAERLLSE